MYSRRRFLAGAAGAGLAFAARPSFALKKSATVREVAQVAVPFATRDGAGVSLSRTLGSPSLPLVDPFLLLDEIHPSTPADVGGGFPRHPHRGFETVSILLEGAFEHRDSVGNHGRISGGGLQWMTAGRGIIHEEMPRLDDHGALWGLQLWVNLPARQKWVAPRYQDLAPSAVPELDVGDARVRVLAGTVGKRRGPVDGIAIRPTMFTATLRPGAILSLPISGEDAALVKVLAGTAQLGERGQPVSAGELAVLGRGDTLTATTAVGARLLVIAGRPIGEPVARRGPFVMNTEAELDQAFADYREGRLTDGRELR